MLCRVAFNRPALRIKQNSQMQTKLVTYRFSVLLISLMSVLAVTAHQAVAADTSDDNLAEYTDVSQFGGPSSVGAQVQSNDEVKKSAYRFEGFSISMQPYYDFKARVNEDHGLAFGGDYHALYQQASDSPGEDTAAGGILRLFGTWTVLGKNSGDKASLVFKIENRHRLGTSITPPQLGSEIGYVGLTGIVFSDAGTLLSNFYWQQSFSSNSVAFVAGIVDATDYLNLYGLVNPWTDFSNLAFSTDPTIPVPNQGLGTAIRAMLTDSYYVLGGFADANGDPTDTSDSVDSFFSDNEYFKHIEIGWISSYDNRYTDNVHLMLWQVDEREVAQVVDGWGVAFSFSQLYGQWLPFARAAYSDGGGGSFLERSVSVGLGYFPNVREDVLGVGINWGRPSEETFGSGLDDQYTAEIYYRIQLFQHATLTPDLQYLRNPALNSSEDSIWVVGLRGKLVF
jgi:porin